MKYCKYLVVNLIIFLVLSCYLPVCAQEQFIPANKLKEYGFNIRELLLIGYSGNGEVFIAFEKTTELKRKAQGTPYILWIFRMKKGYVTKIEKLYLPIPDIIQIAVSYDGKKAVVTGHEGTKILLVDLVAKKTSVLFAHKKNQPGFKADSLLWYYKGKFYLDGYFYDKDRVSQGDWIVSLNLSQTGINVFEKGLNIDELKEKLTKKQVNLLKFWHYVSAEQGFFGVYATKAKKNLAINVFSYNKGLIDRLDTGIAFGGYAGAENRWLYAILKPDLKKQLVLKDIAMNKTWIIAEGKPYAYISLAKIKGNTVVATLQDTKAIKMSYFYAKEEDGFKLKPIKELQNIKKGVFRLSPNGKYFCFFNEDGLRFNFFK